MKKIISISLLILIVLSLFSQSGNNSNLIVLDLANSFEKQWMFR